MSDPGEVTFFDELPDDDGRRGGRYKWFWEALRNNPGRWAAWPGTQHTNNYTTAKKHGAQARRIQGVFYMRMPAPDDGGAE